MKRWIAMLGLLALLAGCAARGVNDVPAAASPAAEEGAAAPGTAAENTPQPEENTPKSAENGAETAENEAAPTQEYAEYSAYYAYFRVPVPDGWGWETNPCPAEMTGEAEELQPFGLVLFPEEAPDFTVEISCWPGFFGMCGTDVTFEQTELDNGAAATLAYEESDGATWYTLIWKDTPGSYTAIWQETEENSEKYGKIVRSMLGQASLGCETLPPAEIISRAASAAEIAPSAAAEASAVCSFDVLQGLWTVDFTGGGTGAIVTLDPQGAVQSVALACGS